MFIDSLAPHGHAPRPSGFTPHRGAATISPPVLHANAGLSTSGPATCGHRTGPRQEASRAGNPKQRGYPTRDSYLV